jgi:hypothetical protein
MGCLASQGSIVYAGSTPGIVAGVTQFNLQLNSIPITGLEELAITVDRSQQSIGKLDKALSDHNDPSFAIQA